MKLIIVGSLIVLGLIGFPKTATQGSTSFIQLNNRLSRLIDSQSATVSIAFQVMNSAEKLFINTRHRVNPASIIKLPIMMIACEDVRQGKEVLSTRLVLSQSDKLGGSGILRYQKNGTPLSFRKALSLMIKKSDNTATKVVIRHLGKGYLNRQFQALGLQETQLGTSNLLSAEGLNYSSAQDALSVLRKIYHQSPMRPNDLLMETLRQQQYRWGIPKYLPKSVHVANKTGTLKHVTHDAGLVYHPDVTYGLVIFISDVPHYLSSREFIATVSKTVFDWVSQTY